MQHLGNSVLHFPARLVVSLLAPMSVAIITNLMMGAPQAGAAILSGGEPPGAMELDEDGAIDMLPGSNISLTRITGPFERPWAIAFLPDGDILVTEKPGRLRLVHKGVLRPDPVAGLPEVLYGDHAGLLDVAIDPDYQTNGLIYLSHMVGTREASTMRVVRARLDEGSLVDQEIVFESAPPAAGLDQLGGRLAIGPDGMLYATLGDRFLGDPAQDIGDHAGSIIRIGRDGRAPEDNPFTGQAGALPELYAIGHRNPQGLAFEPARDRLWSVEHGPQGGDELNLIRPGRNYGWPVITHGIDYDGTRIGVGSHAAGMDQPVRYWVPSVAPSGMTFYEGDRFPGWNGSLLISTLSGQLLRLEIDGDAVVGEEVVLDGQIGRVRDVRAAPDGFIYLIDDDEAGGLYRLEPLFEQAVHADSPAGAGIDDSLNDEMSH
jgi:glucose/arabinose dehydrogenase